MYYRAAHRFRVQTTRGSARIKEEKHWSTLARFVSLLWQEKHVQAFASNKGRARCDVENNLQPLSVSNSTRREEY